MFNRAMLVYNGNAGQGETSSLLESVTGTLAGSIPELTLMAALEPGDGERLCREHGEAFDLVLIMGGDGTVHECVNGLAALKQAPPIGILPAGTCNDFARSLGLPPDPAAAAEEILKGQAVQIDIGTVEDRVFTNFFGVGLITEASDNIDPSLKGHFGKLSYYLSTLQTVRQAEPFRFVLEWDGGRLEDEAVMIYVSNGRFLGARPLPFTLEFMADGRLDVLVIREAGLPLLKELLAWKEEGQWQPKDDSIVYFQASSLKLITETPMRADTDGEKYIDTPCEIVVRRRALSFLTGSDG